MKKNYKKTFLLLSIIVIIFYTIIIYSSSNSLYPRSENLQENELTQEEYMDTLKELYDTITKEEHEAIMNVAIKERQINGDKSELTEDIKKSSFYTSGYVKLRVDYLEKKGYKIKLENGKYKVY